MCVFVRDTEGSRTPPCTMCVCVGVLRLDVAIEGRFHRATQCVWIDLSGVGQHGIQRLSHLVQFCLCVPSGANRHVCETLFPFEVLHLVSGKPNTGTAQERVFVEDAVEVVSGFGRELHRSRGGRKIHHVCVCVIRFRSGEGFGCPFRGLR